MYAWIRGFTRHLERSEAPLPFFVACLMLWIALRELLEIFVFELGPTPIVIAQVVLFYVSLALWLVVAISAASGRSPLAVLRVVFAGFIFVLLAPTLDVLFFGPIDYSLEYFWVDGWSELLRGYVTFFGPLVKKGISMGMRVEIAIVIAATFFYIHGTTGSVGRGVLAMLGAWTAIFVHCSTPSFFPLLAEAAGLRFTESMEQYLRFYVLACIVAVAYILWRGAPHALGLVLRDARWLRLAHYVLLFALGLGLAGGPERLDLDGAMQIALASMAVAITWVVAVMLNNVFDVELDRINDPARPLVTGEIDAGAYERAGYWLAAACLGIAWVAAPSTFAFVAIFGLAYFVYSAPPLRLKTRCFVSKAVIGINSACCLLAGYALWASPVTIALGPLLIVLIGFSLGAHVIDLKDIEGDRAAGIRNLSTMLGLRRAQWVLGSLGMLAYLALALVLRDVWLGWALGALAPILLWAVIRRDYKDGLVVAVQNGALACAVLYVWSA